MATRAERESRDVLIYRLHLAGVSYREIGKRAGITGAAVHKIVKSRLAKAADQRVDLEGVAVAEHLERLSVILAANSAAAAKGDIKAGELCRRILESMARVQGLNTSVAERLIPMRAGLEDDDDGEHEGGMLIDVEERRWIRNR